MGSTIFFTFKVDGDIGKFVNFKDTKKVDNILESSLDVQSFFDAFNVIYQLWEIKYYSDNQKTLE